MSAHENVRLARRIMFTIRRGRVQLVDDTGTVQKLQTDIGPVDPTGASLGLRDKTPHIQHFGFASNPPVKADLIVLAVGGDLSNAVAIASNDQASRPTGLQPGEAVLYDLWGHKVHLTETGIVISEPTGNCTVTLSAAGVRITGANANLSVGGNLSAGNGVSGSFTTPTGQTVTVTNGIVTNIF